VVVPVKEILDRVVALVDVDPAVVVEIRGDYGQALSLGVCYSRFFADVRERAVAVIVKEPARGAFEERRDAVSPFVVVAAENVLRGGPLDKIAYIDIELAVVVEIQPGGARAPALGVQSRLYSHVFEGAVTPVVVENHIVDSGDKQVGISVSVVIPCRDPVAEAPPGHSGFLCHIGEGAIPVIVIKRVSQRDFGLEELRFAAVYQIDVEPAVIVVIQEGAATVHGLRQIPLGRHAILVDPGNPGSRCDVSIDDPNVCPGTDADSQHQQPKAEANG